MGISTHVLDIARGRPADGVEVILERQDAGAWIAIARSVTNADGRCTDLLQSAPAQPASYRLTFMIGAYFATLQIEGLYPEVAVAFLVRSAEEHHHIPLLLAPNGYTTYRGS